MDYCNRSAAPVGRFLLELHGEDLEAFAWSDPLCNALQVINHLQDCAEDYTQLDRVYLPGDWMEEADVTVEALGDKKSSPQLRRVIRRCVKETQSLMVDARKLPHHLVNRGLAMESAVIIKIAQKLIKKLHRYDPVRRRVALNKPELVVCGVLGAISGLLS